MHEDVPLVVPEINPETLATHRGIVSCPNCTTIGLVMSLEPIRRAAGLEEVVVTTLQAASGAGRDGIDELESQQAALREGRPLEPRVFASPIANNVVPLCENVREDAYSTEEMKLRRETQKIFDQPELPVAMTCVRVPVPVGHAATALVTPSRPIAVEEARAALEAFEGVDEPAERVFPTPAEVVGRDEVLVGRLRADFESDRLWLFEVSDSLRKGAATNAVQIAEALCDLPPSTSSPGAF